MNEFWSRRVAISLLAVFGAGLLLTPILSSAADARTPAKVGIIGTGRIGSTFARLWVQAGHPVMLSSRHPEQLKSLAESLGPLATVGTPKEAAKYGDVVFMSVPFAALADVQSEVGQELRGKVVLDPTNAFPPGSDLQKSTAAAGGTGVVNARTLAGAKLVRAFNYMLFSNFAESAHRSGELVGVPIAGDDPAAIAVAEQLVRDAGFEPVLVGPLASAKRFDTGGELPREARTAAEIRALLGLTR